MYAVVVVVATALALSHDAFILSSLVILAGKRMFCRHFRFANVLWYWTKWPALAAIILFVPLQFLLYEKITWLDLVTRLADAFCWRLCRDMGDDDDHKKLKKKMKEKIKQASGKLIVVPEPAA